jgi:hypothetical protein
MYSLYLDYSSLVAVYRVVNSIGKGVALPPQEIRESRTGPSYCNV